jgi:hypothetical protein
MRMVVATDAKIPSERTAMVRSLNFKGIWMVRSKKIGTREVARSVKMLAALTK